MSIANRLALVAPLLFAVAIAAPAMAGSIGGVWRLRTKKRRLDSEECCA